MFLSALGATQKRRRSQSIPRLFTISLVCGIALSGPALANEPDVKNSLPIRDNGSVKVTAVCHKLNEQKYSQLVRATCYSETNQVAVVLVSGKAKSMTGQAVANHILGKFEKAHVPAVAFLDMPHWDGIGITYVLNGVPYGPYSGKNWKDGFEIVKRHSPQAWYKN